ncbi:glycosyltransferase [Neomicrococcus lactis]|uniref:D-inositol 3-phosphate glycosyltransferase n=1 Tax=Neomicrococcus lactis TaxID=732241 RepID=A0A7W8YB23_9MICC|nr:glycosyltransferase involved in cell wall biosynthesis [Neomicrococcus lactis]
MSAVSPSVSIGSAARDVKPIALWVIPVADLGGVARHVLDVFRTGMAKYRLVLFCPEGLLAERVRELGGAVITGSFGPDYGFAQSARSLRGVIKSLKPAIVHTHLAYADFVAAAVLAADRSVKLVSSEHGIAGDDSIYHKNQLKAQARSWAHAARLKRADALIAVAESTKREMQRKWRAPERLKVILNGVDRENDDAPAPASADIQAGGPRVLSLSRLSPEKRIVQLLRAFPRILSEEPGATLTVAGTGLEQSQLEQLTHTLGLDKVVSFAGFVDAQRAMKEHDVLVQLSSWENCSYTLLDAVASGLGVVATPVGGNPEILDAEYLTDAEDTERIARLILDQFTGVKKRPVLETTWPGIRDMLESIEELYDNLS